MEEHSGESMHFQFVAAGKVVVADYSETLQEGRPQNLLPAPETGPSLVPTKRTNHRQKVRRFPRVLPLVLAKAPRRRSWVVAVGAKRSGDVPHSLILLPFSDRRERW